jgi:hypothetical protein
MGLAALLLPVAPGADWQSLTANSPFGPASATAGPTAPDQLEFRGVVQEAGVYYVNLFNPTTKTSQWIPVQGRAPGLEVGAYDSRTDKLQVTQDGRPLTLTLKQARVNLVQPAPAPSAPNAENPADPNQADRGLDGRAGRSGNGGDPAAMMRNLPPEAQAMIQEFRRRRAERASQQNTVRPRQQ